MFILFTLAFIGNLHRTYKVPVDLKMDNPVGKDTDYHIMLAQLLKLTKKRGKSMKPFCKYWRIRAPENLRFFLRGNLILDIITLYNDEL